MFVVVFLTIHTLCQTATQSSLFGELNPKCKDMHVAHLEEVILMYHATVGQVLDQSVGEGGFPSVGYTTGEERELK